MISYELSLANPELLIIYCGYNDIFNKSVSIEEADGVLDIGFESYSFVFKGISWRFFLTQCMLSYISFKDFIILTDCVIGLPITT